MRINPSNTGNVRMQSLWHLGENLRLTFDPSYQYTLANGGGTTTINETPGTSADVRVLGTSNVAGFDLNGDGDILDNVRFYTPNTTNTNRYGATASLIWDLNDDHRLRFAYTYDHAEHRQTGQWGPSIGDGEVENVFAGREGERVYAADGDIIRGRDRLLGRRAEPVRARVPRAVPRRQVHRHRGRARAVLHARAEPVLLHAERRHRQLGHHRRRPAARCAPRARRLDARQRQRDFVPGERRWARSSSSRRTARR